MTDVFDRAPQVWNAAQLREAIKDLPDDTPIHIGVAEDPGDFGGYRESVLVDAYHVENCWPATGTAPERAEKGITVDVPASALSATPHRHIQQPAAPAARR
ncbi:DUF6225 family protein [Streptomyces sp. NPDC053720]|uniref:DUF6225 family protein n=1 Tax=Streptomyces sp. NPDC053720 TaxID=3154855 RepID=UPI0034143063